MHSAYAASRFLYVAGDKYTPAPRLATSRALQTVELVSSTKAAVRRRRDAGDIIGPVAVSDGAELGGLALTALPALVVATVLVFVARALLTGIAGLVGLPLRARSWFVSGRWFGSFCFVGT